MLPQLELDIPWESIDGNFFGIIIECLTVFYAFCGLAIVCDEHLVPALDTLCMKWQIPEDVAGATFMAFGSAAPEIIIAAVTTMQASENPDPDAIALGVTSVVGSGLLAFAVIPAICGIFGGGEDGLVLNRRPLIGHFLAYLASLLILMYTIADGLIHPWEAAMCLIIYLINLFVIVFSRSIRKWYLKNFHYDVYVQKFENRENSGQDLTEPLNSDDHGNFKLANGDDLDAEKMSSWGKEIYLHFDNRPLGFKVRGGDTSGSGAEDTNAIIASVDDEEHDSILIGTQIMAINSRDCVGIPFDCITHWLTSLELPLDIVFSRPPGEHIENWSNGRVKQWWLETLPPALHVYAGIVDECQLDGSDLFELDMEMLQEFGVKRIHGMKVLKAIQRLRTQQTPVGQEANQIIKKLENWEVSNGTLDKLRGELVDKDYHPGKHETSVHGSDHSHGSGEGHAEHGPVMEAFEKAIYPLEVMLAACCPDCEMGSEYEDWYLFTFGMAFLWVAVFSFCISSVIERWVELSGLPMSFFGLLVVSVAAQTPDTLESLAVAKKGYGAMAIANCLGTQTINIGIGLGVPWLITTSSGTKIVLEEDLLVPCWIMVFQLLTVMFLLFSDVIFKGETKVRLTKTRSYMLCIIYCISIILYAVYLVETGQF